MKSNIVFLLFISCHQIVDAANPKIPSLMPNNETSSLIDKSRMKLKHKDVDKHDGYRVIDSKGNEFYVDDIKNPKKKVVITEINNHSKIGNSGKVKVESNVNIKKICFSIHCK